MTGPLTSGVNSPRHVIAKVKGTYSEHWLTVNECGSNWYVSCRHTSHYLFMPPVPGGWCPATFADSGRRQLRSVNYRACVVPQTQNSFSDRAFSVAGPEIWNDLPPELRHVDISFGQFRNILKSFSLGFSQPRRIVTFWLLRLWSFLPSFLTYLLTYLLV